MVRTYFFGKNIYISLIPWKSLQIQVKATKPWGKFTDPFDLVFLLDAILGRRDSSCFIRVPRSIYGLNYLFSTFFAFESPWLLLVRGHWSNMISYASVMTSTNQWNWAFKNLGLDMNLLGTFVKSSIDGVVIELDKGNTPYVAGEKVCVN